MNKRGKRNFLVYLSLFFIILLISVSGCVQNAAVPPSGTNMNDTASKPDIAPQEDIEPEKDPSPYPITLSSEKINMTIHSVQASNSVWHNYPLPGNVLLAVDATIRNNQESRSFRFTDDRIYLLENGAGRPNYPITEKMNEGSILNPFVRCTIEPGTERRGTIMFGVYETTDEAALFLVDGLGNTLLSADLPVDREIREKVNVTVHSAIATTKIGNLTPLSGNIFIIINMTVENLAEKEDYILNEKTLDITGGGPLTGKCMKLWQIPSTMARSRLIGASPEKWCLE